MKNSGLTFLVCALALGTCQSALAQERTTPITSWFTTSDFPADWTHKHPNEGVIVRFAVTPEGRAKNCKPLYIKSKSDFSVRVCQLIEERARYVPAYGPSGQPIEGEDQLDVTWRSGEAIIGETDFGGAMPANNPSTWITSDDGLPTKLKRARPGILNIYITFSISPDGRMIECQASAADSPDAAATACKLLTKRARFLPPMGHDGNPLPTQGRTIVHWQTF